MSSLAAIGFSIRNQVKGFFSSDDERIDIELIYKMVKQVRSTMAKNRYKEVGSVDELMYQEICCLEVKCTEIICNGTGSGTFEYSVDLPILEDIYGNIKYFGSGDKKYSFTEKNWRGHLYAKASPYTGNLPYFTRVQNRAIIGNIPTPDMKFACIIALLADPLNGGCYLLDENDDFPISSNMIHELELICIKQLMSTLQIAPDNKNDANNMEQNPKTGN
jgi:hypothetical protein